MNTCSRSHRNESEISFAPGVWCGSLRWFVRGITTGARLMWESGNPLSLEAGHSLLIKERTHRWNINAATVQQTLIDESLSLGAERQKAPGYCVSFKKSSELKRHQNFATTQGRVHHVYRQLTSRIWLSPLTSCHITSATNTVHLTKKYHCLWELTTVISKILT